MYLVLLMVYCLDIVQQRYRSLPFVSYMPSSQEKVLNFFYLELILECLSILSPSPEWGWILKGAM